MMGITRGSEPTLLEEETQVETAAAEKTGKSASNGYVFTGLYEWKTDIYSCGDWAIYLRQWLVRRVDVARELRT